MIQGAVVLVRKINVRHVFERRLRSFLTVSGIAAGVALVVSISVINSTLESSARANIRNLAGDAEIEVAAPSQVGLPQTVVNEIAAVEGVERAVPALRAATQMRGPDGAERVQTLGVTHEFITLFPRGLGELADVQLSGGVGSGDGIILSQLVAQDIGARVGRPVIVTTPGGHRSLEVTGIISGPGVQLVSGGRLGLMHLPAAQAVFDKIDKVDSIYVVTDPDEPVSAVQARIDERLDGAALVGPPGERGEGFERTFSIIAALTSLAGTVALFVALFVVYNTMSMALAERRREISLALAMGTTRRQLFLSVLTEALALGIVASGAGIAIGLWLPHLIVERATEQFVVVGVEASGPVVVEAWHLLLGVVAGVGVSVIGALLPARRVMKVAPVEALRPEANHEWARFQPKRLSGKVAVLLGASGIGATLVGMVVYARTGAYIYAALALTLGLAGITVLLPFLVPAGVAVIRPAFTRLFGTVGRLAADGLEKNPSRTSLTVGALAMTLGLVLGVGVAMGSFWSQFRDFANHWYESPLYVQTSSHRGGVYSDQPLELSLEEKIEDLPGAAQAFPFRYANMNVEGEHAVLYVSPISDGAREGMLSALSVGGSDPEPLADALDRGEVVIARQMASRRSLEVGDSIDLPTPQGRETFRIGGLFYDLGSFDSMHISFETYSSLWNDPHVDQFGVVPEDGTSVATLERTLDGFVEDQAIAARVLTRPEIVEQVLNSVQQLLSIAEGVQFAALVVAFMTIVNTMFTTVLERRWEFGLQRAVGMGGGQLGRAVMLEASAIGLLGVTGAVILGTALGILMLSSMNLLMSFNIPFEFPWTVFSVSLFAGIGLSMLSSLYPRRVAVRAPIIESLRYE